MAQPVIDQTAFQGYDDDDVPGAATVKGIVGADWTQLVDTNFRIRYALTETNSKVAANEQFIWEYNLGGAGWNDITGASNVVIVVATDHYADEDRDDTPPGVAGGGEALLDIAHRPRIYHPTPHPAVPWCKPASKDVS